MEVILLQRVHGLGQMGSTVTVKPGYARNFLLPQKKALRATKENMSIFEKRKAELETHNLSKKQEALELAKELQGTILTLIRQAGDSGHLYGSVSSRDIVQALAQNSIQALRSQVTLNTPIKEVGVHTASLSLHPEVTLPLTLVVAQSAEEGQAKLQAFQRGKSAS